MPKLSSKTKKSKTTKKPPVPTRLTEGGKLLLKYLTDRNMTQRKFAAKIDVSTAYVSMLTNGKTTPSLAVAVKIQKIAKKVKPASWTIAATP